jgi:two-component system, chemotaxis family, protein-glutamate methylesterase/glutaminase
MTPPAGVVAVGASLGGLLALEALLKGLAPSFPGAIVVAQHRRPDSDGRLVELLQRHSKLPVSEPDDKLPIAAGQVYVAPANYHLIVERGFFSLSVDPPVYFARPSIDVLFESVADSYGPRGVAVMLTSSNEDGADGAAAIKNAGGRVLVQDPRTAEAPVGPLAVIARVAVDGIVSLEALPGLLTQLFASS